MIEIRLRELALVIDGTLIGDGDACITATVETDSRLISRGSLFFAKPGEKADGHDFVSDAIQNGAIAAVVERQLPDQINQIVVKDSVKALGALAAWLVSQLRSRGNLRVVGITGSNGKTTTKNMLREILSKVGPTTAPIESFNNHVGAPISILRADAKTQFLIVEMGAKGLGSIDYLARIADPDVGVILKVGLAHVGEFGGIDKTAAIKGELAAAMQPTGKLVLNLDDSLVCKMKDISKAPVTWFGTGSEATYRAEDITLTERGTSFTMCWPDGQAETISLQIIGDFHIMNALAAAAASELLGASRQQIRDGLQSIQLAERWRMQRLVRSDGVTIINDAYNASPDSMKAALQTLAQLGRLGSRTVAVLGHMAELGDLSVSEHDAMGRLVVRLNIGQLVVVGDEAKLIHMAASQEGSWDGESQFFSTIDEALEYLRGILSQGDTVLVKSSKSANLRFLGDRLMEAAE
jgi:UDP-N-acetylmuramoyl-tripeptide--D-alanyl-D-alanine ligase